MPLTNDEKAELVGDMLEWQISAATGARDHMREDSPVHRYACAYVYYLTEFRNILLQEGGGVYDPDFMIPKCGPQAADG